MESDRLAPSEETCEQCHARENYIGPRLRILNWGAYHNLGYISDPGCFRYHDNDLSTSEKEIITRKCESCHQALAVDEPAPEIPKTLR